MKSYRRCAKYTIFIIALLLTVASKAQVIVKEFNPATIHQYNDTLKQPESKLIPAAYSNVIRVALSYYPELEHLKIEFRIKEQASPLTTRIQAISIFRRAKKRTYIVTISNQANKRFDPILLENLGTNARIGVLGHELAHVSDYSKRRSLYFIWFAIENLSKKAIDKHEYATDMSCIEHGLGYQLLSWSMEVRTKLKTEYWEGVKQMQMNGRERYMNPGSIEKEIQNNKKYR